jgi:diketogulonate reductase-like aldo/keto reductase
MDFCRINTYRVRQRSVIFTFTPSDLQMSSDSVNITLNDSTITSWIAFGTGTALFSKDAAQSVELAIRNGFTHLDGAQAYSNEESLGKGIVASGKPRSELYVTTKLFKLKTGQTVKEALQESLKKLELDYVDLFLIHHAAHHEGRLQQVWKEMEGVKNEGLTRYAYVVSVTILVKRTGHRRSIGVSNFTEKDLNAIFEVATIKPAVNQVCCFLAILFYLFTCLSDRVSSICFQSVRVNRQI